MTTSRPMLGSSCHVNRSSGNNRHVAAGSAHGSMPSLLSSALQRGLNQLKAVYTEAEQAGISSLGTLPSLCSSVS